MFVAYADSAIFCVTVFAGVIAPPESYSWIWQPCYVLLH